MNKKAVNLRTAGRGSYNKKMEVLNSCTHARKRGEVDVPPADTRPKCGDDS